MISHVNKDHISLMTLLYETMNLLILFQNLEYSAFSILTQSYEQVKNTQLPIFDVIERFSRRLPAGSKLFTLRC